MNLKLSSRDMMIVAVLAIVAVAALIVAFLIVPRFSEVGQLNSRIGQADQQVRDAQNTLARRQDAKAAAAKTQSDLLLLNNEMPDTPELPTLIIELQDTANEAGLDFLSVSPKEPTTDSGFAKIQLDLSVTGQWADHIEYMRRLAKLDRQLRILKITFASSGTSSGTSSATEAASTDLRADITIEVYMLSTGQGTTAAPPASTTATQ